MDTGDWIAGAALFVSALSLMYSVLNARRIEKKHDSLMSVIVQNGFMQRQRGTGRRDYAVYVVLKNRSKANNSVTDVDLLVSYEIQGRLHTVKISHDAELAAVFQQERGTSLGLPLNLAPNSSSAFWAYFRADDGLLNDANVQGYQLQVKDNFDKKYIVETGYFQETYPDV